MSLRSLLILCMTLTLSLMVLGVLNWSVTESSALDSTARVQLLKARIDVARCEDRVNTYDDLLLRADGISDTAMRAEIERTGKKLAALETQIVNRPLTIVILILVVMVLNWLFMLAIPSLMKFPGPGFWRVVSRVTGVIIAAMALQIILFGLRDLGIVS